MYYLNTCLLELLEELSGEVDVRERFEVGGVIMAGVVPIAVVVVT